MAASNRDRIGQMFELMSPPLDQFIGAAVADVLTDGASWVSLVELKDRQKDITGKTYSESDPQVQLRMLTENIPHQLKKGWYPFDDALGRVGQGYATELRNCRNAWAHNESFSDDDAYRYLDTGERLMTLVGASNVADEVRAIRLSLRRITADKDDKKVIASAFLAIARATASQALCLVIPRRRPISSKVQPSALKRRAWSSLSREVTITGAWRERPMASGGNTVWHASYCLMRSGRIGVVVSG